jgi:hypothetical protein
MQHGSLPRLLSSVFLLWGLGTFAIAADSHAFLPGDNDLKLNTMEILKGRNAALQLNKDK